MIERLPLSGRVAIVTGVSRRRGIGFAIARRLAGLGASLHISGYAPHDAAQPWGADDTDAVAAELRAALAPGARLSQESLDLAQPGAGEALIGAAAAALGHVDILVANHALSGSDGPLAAQTEATLTAHWRTNTLSTILATQALAAQHDGRPGGRVVWLTSGQVRGPMPDEIAYVAAKAALAGTTASVAQDLAARGIVLNTVNPGPVNTGYLDAGQRHDEAGVAALRARFPGGELGTPDDPARLIAWLCTDDARWVVGQVISTEGGFA